jgi:3-oxoacyl-[acyl-carrier protein] reductase
LFRRYGKLNHIVNNGAFRRSFYHIFSRQWLPVTTAGFTYDRMLHTMPDDTWDIIMKVHVRAPFRLIRAAAPLMRIKPEPGKPHENRSIINVSSTSGLHGNVGQANYAAAKSAIIGFTKTIAKEWGVFGVRANTVAFGYILTR